MHEKLYHNIFGDHDIGGFVIYIKLEMREIKNDP